MVRTSQPQTERFVNQVGTGATASATVVESSTSAEVLYDLVFWGSACARVPPTKYFVSITSHVLPTRIPKQAPGPFSWSDLSWPDAIDYKQAQEDVQSVLKRPEVCKLLADGQLPNLLCLVPDVLLLGQVIERWVEQEKDLDSLFRLALQSLSFHGMTLESWQKRLLDTHGDLSALVGSTLPDAFARTAPAGSQLVELPSAVQPAENYEVIQTPASAAAVRGLPVLALHCARVYLESYQAAASQLAAQRTHGRFSVLLILFLVVTGITDGLSVFVLYYSRQQNAWFLALLAPIIFVSSIPVLNVMLFGGKGFVWQRREDCCAGKFEWLVPMHRSVKLLLLVAGVALLMIFVLGFCLPGICAAAC